MEHITDTRIEQSEPTAVTLGNFDGLHQGHRSLINLTKQFAEEEGLKSVVFTFSPHPMFVFQSGSFSCYTFNRWVHPRFWRKTCSNRRLSMHFHRIL